MCRCSGQCCEGFPVNMETNERLQLAAKLMSLGRVFLGRGQSRLGPEIPYIADMVIPMQENDDDRGRYTIFECKYFDPETRLCTAYDQRPYMCSEFPAYGDPTRKCSIEGCTYNECGCQTKVAK